MCTHLEARGEGSGLTYNLPADFMPTDDWETRRCRYAQEQVRDHKTGVCGWVGVTSYEFQCLDRCADLMSSEIIFRVAV